MKWTAEGWDCPPDERGIPYEQWRNDAAVAMIAAYSRKRQANAGSLTVEPNPNSLVVKAKPSKQMGLLFRKS